MSKSNPKSKQLDARQERVQAKYTFTGEELVELGRIASREQNEAESLDRQLSSIKKDFQGRIEGAEMRRNMAFSKLNDGFEMREYEAVIVFNRPKKGSKTLYYLDTEADNKCGAMIRVESMTPGDCQQELFDQRRAEEEAKKAKEEAESKGKKQIPNPVLDEEETPHVKQGK
jgi:hypothetical protein